VREISLYDGFTADKQILAQKLATSPAHVSLVEDLSGKLLCLTPGDEPSNILLGHITISWTPTGPVIKGRVTECKGVPPDFLSNYVYRSVFVFQGPNWTRENNYCFQKGDEWIVLVDTGKLYGLQTSPAPKIGLTHSTFKVIRGDTQISYKIFVL
jgi:hypothetical protein